VRLNSIYQEIGEKSKEPSKPRCTQTPIRTFSTNILRRDQKLSSGVSSSHQLISVQKKRDLATVMSLPIKKDCLT